MTRKSLLSPPRSRNDLQLFVITDNDVLTKKTKLSSFKKMLIWLNVTWIERAMLAKLGKFQLYESWVALRFTQLHPDYN